MSYDTADEVYGPDPTMPPPGAMAGPGTVAAAVPAAIDPNMRGLASLHPMRSPTPWVIGLAVVLVLLLHPRAGFGGNVGVKVG